MPAVANEALRLEPRDPGQPRLAAGVRGVHMPVEHQRRPAARARPRPKNVRASVLDLLPLHGKTELLALSRHPAAIACSEPVKLGIETAASASATRRSRSITGRVLHPGQSCGRRRRDDRLQAGVPPGFEAADEIRDARMAQIGQRRGGKAGRVALVADEDQLEHAIGDVRVGEAGVRIDAPFEHRPRHVHRARDDPDLRPFVVDRRSTITLPLSTRARASCGS